jgi:peptidyl-prolyl cis-trans isomerase C
VKAFSLLSVVVSAGLMSAQTPPAAATKKPAAPTTKPAATTAAKPAAKPVAKKPEDGTVILTINTEKITDKEFDAFLDALPEQIRAQARTRKRDVAEQLIRVKILATAARQAGVEKDPVFQKKLRFQTDNLLAGSMFQKWQESTPADDATLQKYYDSHKQELESITARHILVRFKGSAVPLKEGEKDLTEEEALAKATEVRKKLVAGEDFAKLAMAESDDTGSGKQGGDLGTFKRGQMVGAFEKAAFDLQVKQVSEPVKTQFGYHLIIVDKHSGTDLASVKDEIEKKVRPEAAKEALEVARKKATVTFDDGYFGPAPAAVPAPVMTPPPAAK